MSDFSEIIDGANINKDRPQINPAEYESIVCDKCGCALFRSAIIIKKIPGLLLASPRETENVPDDIWVCNNCGAPIKEAREFYKLDEHGCHTETIKNNDTKTDLII